MQDDIETPNLTDKLMYDKSDYSFTTMVQYQITREVKQNFYHVAADLNVTIYFKRTKSWFKGVSAQLSGDDCQEWFGRLHHAYCSLLKQACLGKAVLQH